MTAVMKTSKFHGFDVQRYWKGLEQEKTVKLLAKMFREITHLKPPRGRSGRHLDHGGHFAVETRTENGNHAFAARQEVITFIDEMEELENKTQKQSRYKTEYSPTESFEADTNRLQKWHNLHQGRLRMENTVGSLQDLVQGLMGLGLKNIEYEKIGFYEQSWSATLELDGFTITIQEKKGG